MTAPKTKGDRDASFDRPTSRSRSALCLGPKLQQRQTAGWPREYGAINRPSYVSLAAGPAASSVRAKAPPEWRPSLHFCTRKKAIVMGGGERRSVVSGFRGVGSHCSADLSGSLAPT